jgi:hypothetical protein
VLDDEVRSILRELLAGTGGRTATIAPSRGAAHAGGDGPDGDAAPIAVAAPGGTARTAALGGGLELRLELAQDGDPASTELATAVEHAVRALRAAARRWELGLPALTIGGAADRTQERALGRVVAYLGALASVQHARNACVVVDHRLVAWARPPEALDEARWPLLERRAEAAAPAGASSHGEVTDPDVYAVTFWYGAALIVYFAGPYGVDFIRHRARLVTRELTVLLPLLDPDPSAPGQTLPVP